MLEEASCTGNTADLFRHGRGQLKIDSFRPQEAGPPASSDGCGFSCGVEACPVQVGQVGRTAQSSWFGYLSPGMGQIHLMDGGRKASICPSASFISTRSLDQHGTVCLWRQSSSWIRRLTALGCFHNNPQFLPSLSFSVG